MATQSSYGITITFVTLASIGVALHCHRRVKILEKELRSLRSQSRIKAMTSVTTEAAKEEAKNSFTMTEIGRIHSPFPQRAGCPRQGGNLAPHIRSRLIFHNNIPMDMLDGINSYSHVWVVFAFHLNPRGKASSGRQGQVKLTATKIRPPRANGIKVGVLATRAPHRPNPVGLSLGLVEKVELVSFQGSKRVCLMLRGLDLVDDTPVYDIKPYVPWDRVDSLESSPMNASLSVRMQHVVTPKWVTEDDELPQVEWAEAATDALLKYADVLGPLYDVAAEAKSAISEIVAQDPRALYDGRGKLSDDDFHFSFGSLRVSFRVQDGAVHVTQVVLDEGDLKAAPGSYPHNLALRRRAEANAREKGRQLEWRCSVKEGITDDLFDLEGGGRYIP
ncbi:hypothetical protein MHU86_10615 [Fragilaria crotonensis]|nr:hypothetical protein MHU86_10615 [Fragilaria crotonensis]